MAARRYSRVGPQHAVLAAILVLSGLLEFVRLSQNGFANDFYSAAVKSMLRSWHNFFFVSSDPNGFITVDKPPLALWLQGLSAKLFGFAPLSLIVPEGDLRGARGGDPLPDRRVAVWAGRRAAERVLTGRLSVVRRGVARERCRSAADPVDARGLRGRARGDRFRAPADAGGVRRAGRAGVQHEVACRVPLRPGNRRRLHGLCAGHAATARRAADRRRGGVRDRRRLVVGRRRPDAGGAAPLRRRQHEQLGVPARVRLQRLRARRRAAGGPRINHDLADPGTDLPARTPGRRRCAARRLRAALVRDPSARRRCRAASQHRPSPRGADRPPAPILLDLLRRHAQSGPDLWHGPRRSGRLADTARADRHDRGRLRGARPSRSTDRGAVRPRRLVPCRAPDARLLRGDRASVLRLGTGTGDRRDGRRRCGRAGVARGRGSRTAGAPRIRARGAGRSAARLPPNSC